MDKSIRKLAVIGAGTMGAAIAACGARAGLDVVLMVRGKGSESGRDRAARAVDTILKKGEMGTVPQYLTPVFGSAYVIFRVPAGESWDPVNNLDLQADDRRMQAS